MPDRYFVESRIAADRAALVGAEAHHLLHVMRAKPGSRVTLFDGTGWEYDAVVERAGRTEVELAISGRQEIDREAAVAVTLGVALPKGERQKWLVEKLVELGAARLVPLETERAVAQPGENALERLRRTVIEASKQCGRNRLMQVAAAETWSGFLAEQAGEPCRLVAHPGSHSPVGPFNQERVALAIGPEGGFSGEEIARAVAQGWRLADLGQRMLRIETAALALAARVIGSGRAES